MTQPRILFLDVETAPNLAYVWGRWEQNVIEVHTHWYMLSFAWKWQGEKRINCRALPDYPGTYLRDRQHDRRLIEALWGLMDMADVVIAHNGDAFDIKKFTARCLFHGLRPPSPSKSIDTLKIARKYFRMDSNKLDHLGAMLKVGRKLPNTGKDLWLGCMNGKASAWRMMKRYNKHDVALLEAVYEKLKPWANNHPDLSVYNNRRGLECPSCQSSEIFARGLYYSKVAKYQRWSCRSCGRWFQGAAIRK